MMLRRHWKKKGGGGEEEQETSIDVFMCVYIMCVCERVTFKFIQMRLLLSLNGQRDPHQINQTKNKK